LPLTKQAEVLRISRGSVYYLPRPVPEADLSQDFHRAAACGRVVWPTHVSGQRYGLIRPQHDSLAQAGPQEIFQVEDFALPRETRDLHDAHFRDPMTGRLF
jgi:hypothetical protein